MTNIEGKGVGGANGREEKRVRRNGGCEGT